MPHRLFALLMTLTAGPGCYSQPAPPSEFVPGLEVLQYDVDLEIDTSSLEVAGRATLQIVRNEEIRRLRLALNGPRADSVRVAGQRVAVDQRAADLEVELPPDAGDSLYIDIFYRGTPREGLYSGEIDGERFIYTDGWPARIAGWLPGVHHPAHPARLNLAIRGTEGQTVAASGQLVREEEGLSEWELNASAPTYSFAFAIGPYERLHVTDAPQPVIHYMPQTGSDRFLSRAPEAIAFMDSLLAPYPFGSFTTVAVPFDFAGMENASCAFLAASLYGTPALEEVLVHEVVHQWFGNRVIIADWRDLWISEGTTTYLTTVFYERADGEEVAADVRADFSTVAADDADAGRPLVPGAIDSPYDMLNWRVYRKGAAVHHLLRLKLGDDAYFGALRDIYARYEGQSVSTEAFLQELTERSAEDLQPLIDYWIYGQRIPRLVVEWDEEARFLTWSVEGDDGTLEDVPFLIEVTTGGETWHVNRLSGGIQLPSADLRPAVRPVGIMMTVE